MRFEPRPSPAPTRLYSWAPIFQTSIGPGSTCFLERQRSTGPADRRHHRVIARIAHLYARRRIIPALHHPTAGRLLFSVRRSRRADRSGQMVLRQQRRLFVSYAPGSANPNSLTVSAKVRPYGVDLSGKSNVTIQGLNLFAATINGNSSCANIVIDGSTATFASHFTTLLDNRCCASSYWFDRLGGTGIIHFRCRHNRRSPAGIATALTVERHSAPDSSRSPDAGD